MGTEVSFLQLLWFILIGVLFSGFFILEGFDFGVGMLHLVLAKTEHERDIMQRSIAPVWDGNQVWLLTAGGAMFASYPYWYAALFSGFYIPMFIILCGLILRGVSFIFREKSVHKTIWDYTFSVGSFLPPFILGMVFTALVQGMPLDAQGNMAATFTDYVTPFSLTGGIAVSLLCLLQGLNYLTLKTHGIIRERAHSLAKILYGVLFIGLILFATLLFFVTDFFTRNPFLTVFWLVEIVTVSLLATIYVYKRREGPAFICSSLTLVFLVALLFCGLFPRVMISSLSPNYSILMSHASSSSYTLLVMTIVTVLLLPFVLAYQIWTYYVFRERVG